MNEDKKFVVNLAPGQEKAEIHVIESVKQLKDEYNFHYTGFKYTAGSSKAIIYLLRYFNRGKEPANIRTVIFYDEKQIQVIVDESVKDRTQDMIVYNFEESLQLRDWKKAFGKALSQKEFIDLLKRRPADEVEDRDVLLASVQTVRMATEISGDFEYMDNNNVVVGVKIKDTASSTIFPATFDIFIPLINESDYFDSLEIELTVNKPRNEGDKLTFQVDCPKLPYYWQEAVKAELAYIKSELPEYLIVAGKPWF